MQATEQRYYSPAEYLALEEAADFRSEYTDGLIIPMTGGSTNHNRLAGNLHAGMVFGLPDDYEPFIGDVRLWIPKKRIYTYPDIMVIAGDVAYHDERTDTVLNPQVIVEVLSKSTEQYDRQGKFAAYRTLPSFQEYLLIDQTQVLVEHYFKTAKKRWSFVEYDEEDESIKFETIPFEISLAALYKRVKFETTS